jgi:hypothetical protein
MNIINYFLYLAKEVINVTSTRGNMVIGVLKKKTDCFCFFCFLICLSAILSLTVDYFTIQKANGQFIPLPPPAPDTVAPSSTDNLQTKGPKDTTSPQIEFLTTELREGKNVFKVNITDDSDIRLREIRFVENGKINTVDLVRDQGTVYKGLISVNGPSAVIVVNIDDIYGNKATLAKSIPVLPPNNILSQILERLTKIFSPE